MKCSQAKDVDTHFGLFTTYSHLFYKKQKLRVLYLYKNHCGKVSYLDLGCVPYYSSLHLVHPGMLKIMHNNLKSQIKLCLLEMLKQDLNPS